MLNPSIHPFSIHQEPIDHQAVGAEDKAGKTFSLRFFSPDSPAVLALLMGMNKT